MAGIVQNQSQVDENFRQAMRQAALQVGQGVPFVPGQVKPSVRPEKRLQARERKRLPKGFMAGGMQTLARLFTAQRGDR